MADPLTVTLDPARLTLQPGAQGTATVIVRNKTEEVEPYWLRSEGAPEGWVQFVPDQLSAFPLQEVRAQVTVRVPENTPGATYHLIVRAVSQEHAGIEGKAQLDVEVPLLVQPVTTPVTPVTGETSTVSAATTQPVTPTRPIETPRPQTAAQIEVKAEPATDSKLPPPAAQWRITLHNAGTVLDTYSFSIRGVRSEWVMVDPPEVTLKPDEQASATLTITPTPDAPASMYAFTLRTFSHLNLNQRTDLPLQVVVKPSAKFTLAISPRDAEAQGTREFKVALVSDAASNSDLNIDLSASDQDSACEYTFDPAQVFLPARESVTSTLRVRPRAVLGANERKTYTIQVTATPRGSLAAPQQDQARLTQVGAKPLSLTLRPQVQTTDLDADYSLVAVNPSSVEAALLLTASDPELACAYTFQPERLVLPAGGQAQARLHVHAANFYDGEGTKTYTFTAAATREGDLIPTATAEGRLTQRQIKPVKLLLVPPQQSQTGEARFVVQAQNPRATPVRIWLEAADEADALSIACRPNLIALSPGAEGRATLIARPKDKLMQGEQRRVHKFVVTGRIEGPDQPITASGVLAQTSGADFSGALGKVLVFALWLGKWLIALAILLVLGNLFFDVLRELGCRRPQVSSLMAQAWGNAIGQFFLDLPSKDVVHAVVHFIGEVATQLFNLPQQACR